MIAEICSAYGELLRRVDTWFGSSLQTFSAEISCRTGCSGCCRSLFDITLLDAWYLREGVLRLPDDVRLTLAAKAQHRLEALEGASDWFRSPYLLNIRPEADWEVLMPDEDETPCVMLDAEGRCLVYDHRPMTCRLHGLPLVDLDGEIFHDGWCTFNFTQADPLQEAALRFPFRKHFEDELDLFNDLTTALVGRKLYELDTFIPAAAVVAYDSFDWRSWYHEAARALDEAAAANV